MVFLWAATRGTEGELDGELVEGELFGQGPDPAAPGTLHRAHRLEIEGYASRAFYDREVGNGPVPPDPEAHRRLEISPPTPPEAAVDLPNDVLVVFRVIPADPLHADVDVLSGDLRVGIGFGRPGFDRKHCNAMMTAECIKSLLAGTVRPVKQGESAASDVTDAQEWWRETGDTLAFPTTLPARPGA